MTRKTLLPFVALLLTLVLAPTPSRAFTVTYGNFWTADFVGSISTYVHNGRVVVTHAHIAGADFSIDRASRFGTLNVTLDPLTGSLHSTLTTAVTFTDATFTAEPAVAIFDSSADLLDGAFTGVFSIGVQVIDSADGVTVLYATPGEETVTNGSVFISP